MLFQRLVEKDTDYYITILKYFGNCIFLVASLVAQLVKNRPKKKKEKKKNPPAMQETLVRFLGQEDALEKG